MSARDKLGDARRFVRDNISNVEPAHKETAAPAGGDRQAKVFIVAIGFFLAAVAAFVLAVAVLRGSGQS